MMSALVFLPGASGSQNFWKPLVRELAPEHYHILSYSGFDGTTPDIGIQNLTDLQHALEPKIPSGSILIAQSMGGVLAMGMALAPNSSVKALILIATSGGLDTQALGCTDWRLDYRHQYQDVPDWFWKDQTHYSEEQLASINIPVLLVWGSHDPLSTVQVGQYLGSIMHQAKLHIIEGGDHFLALNRAQDIAPIIQNFIQEVGRS